MRVDGLQNLNKPLNYSFSRCDVGIHHNSNNIYYKGYGTPNYPETFELSSIFHLFNNIVFEDKISELPSPLYKKLQEIAPYMYYSGKLEDIDPNISFKGYYNIYIDKIQPIPVKCKRVVVWHNNNINYSNASKVLNGEVEFHRNINSPTQDKPKFEELHNEVIQLQYDKLYINQHDAVLNNYTETTGDIFYDILTNKKRLYAKYKGNYYQNVSQDLLINKDYNFIPAALVFDVNIPYRLLEGYKVTKFGLLKNEDTTIKPIIQWKSLC